MSAPKPIEQLSFEESLSELETIVRGLEQGETNLEDSISSYERGITLKKHCEKKLHDAKAKIEKITIGKDGALTTAPFEEKE